MENSYKSIAKTNSLFGGMTFINIIVNVVRSKFLAVLLGPEGIGILGLYSSTIDLVKGATTFGLSGSAVRDMAIAGESNNQEIISETILIISKLVWITGFLGMIVVFIFAPQLSEYTFGSSEFTIEFRFLSIILLIGQLTVRNMVILQGLRILKELAKTNIYGNMVGLLLTLPLYYFYGFSAIVPSFIVTSIISFLFTWFYSKRVKVVRINISWINAFKKGRPMIVLGIMMSLSGFMDVIHSYVIRIIITRVGDLSQVGMYNAGFGFVVSYVGLVFTAITSDYSTRLCAVNNSTIEYNNLVNRQLELMLLVLAPIIVLFIAASPLTIIILYSNEFLPIRTMINWIAVGMVLRAVSWCQGCLYIAKGDSKLYILIYIFAFTKDMALDLLFYYYMGLVGIGISFLISYLIGVVVTIIIVKRKYGCVYYKNTKRLILISMMVTLTALFLSYLEGLYVYFLYILLFASISFYSYRQLDKRLGLTPFLKNIVKKYGK